MIKLIDNLLKYYKNIINNCSNYDNCNKKNKFTKLINLKTTEIYESDFKQHILKICHQDNKYWVNPIDVLIMSINSIKYISNYVNLTNVNKFTTLWIVYIINLKYICGYDNEENISLEYLSNLGGFQLKDYVNFERMILPLLKWKLEISTNDYNEIFNNAILINCI